MGRDLECSTESEMDSLWEGYCLGAGTELEVDALLSSEASESLGPLQLIKTQALARMIGEKAKILAKFISLIAARPSKI